jgi:hypothetical protein
MARKVDADKHFKEAQRAYARGGHDQRMFGPQVATTKRPGITGKLDVRGPGQQFADGGVNRTPGRASRVGVAAPSAPGQTGNVRGAAVRSSRNYGKPK